MKLPVNNFYFINVGGGGGGGVGRGRNYATVICYPCTWDRIGCEVYSEPSGTAEHNFGLPGAFHLWISWCEEDE